MTDRVRRTRLARTRQRGLPSALFLVFGVCGLFPVAARAQYTESFQVWAATSADVWQTKDLAAAPFNVPANAVVEIAVRNDSDTAQRYGGVRAVGSGLERRFLLHNAPDGGQEIVVMHVQADAGSDIQHYSDNTGNVDFVLLGYWNTGTYVETFSTFTAGADGSWQDENLNAFGVGASQVAEIVIHNNSNTEDRLAGVRTNGSALNRYLEIHENSSFGDDLAGMFVQADGTANATIDCYAETDADITFYLVGYWSTPPGKFTEKISNYGDRLASATWEDVLLTGDNVPPFAIAEFVLGNLDDVVQRNLGVRTPGSSLSRFLNLQESEANPASLGGSYARMHVPVDVASTVQLYQADIASPSSFHLTGFWTPVLSDHAAGQQPDAFSQSGSVTNAELFGFQFTPISSFTVTQLVFRLTNLSGLVNGDWAGVEIVVDTNGDGSIGGGETTTVGGAGSVNQAAGTITFSTSFVVSATTNYILRADFASLSTGDRVTIDLEAADVTTTAAVRGDTSTVTHLERCSYVPKFETWSATGASAWETQSLGGTPYSVPANAVVEVAAVNVNTTTEHDGGFRALGSGLERRFQIHETESSSLLGVDVVVMHVQADASSQIQHYSGDTASVSFVLLGYWECGTYVERFDTFTAGANATWNPVNLCSYGVSPGHVAELVITNDSATANRQAGARTNGSSLARLLDLQEAQDGGVDTATMWVEADTSKTATIRVYAQTNSNVDFYLVGYWSVAPLAYTELYADPGSPSADLNWEEIDLTASGVPDDAVVEFSLSHEDGNEDNYMGLRKKDQALNRRHRLAESEDGGGNIGRMHVAGDPTAKVELFHQDVSDLHTFQITGYWSACDTSISYVIGDLGAVNAANSSLAWHLNSSENVAGFDENTGGNANAWFLNCGAFTSLGTLGGTYAEAHGINNSDRVVGWAHDASGRRHAFTWTSGSGMVDLGIASGRAHSEALSVNANAEVVGTLMDFTLPPSNRLAFLYLPAPAYTLGAGMNSLGTLGGTQSVGMDINDSGRVVGGAQNASGNYRPFRWNSGTMTDLGTLGGDSVLPSHRAEAVNTSGNIAGRSYTAAGAARAFYWNGSMSNLGVLTGGTESWAFGLNDSNVVVGTSNVTGGAYHAFVWDSTNGLRNLNNLIPGSSGWTLIRATDVNNEGFITGWGTNGSGQTRAFLLTPSCSAGGGGAAAASAALASGGGITDGAGTFSGSAIDFEGVELARIEILGAEPGRSLEYQVIEPTHAVEPMPESDVATSEGFADGVSLSRTLTVGSSVESGQAAIVVSMNSSLEEIADLGVAADELQLYVYESPSDANPGAWVPAGTNIGKVLPTGVVGDSGYTILSDGTVEYWTVRDHGGVFAVGKSSPSAQEPPPSESPPTPRMCGVAMIQPLLVCSIVLGWHRRRRC